ESLDSPLREQLRADHQHIGGELHQIHPQLPVEALHLFHQAEIVQVSKDIEDQVVATEKLHRVDAQLHFRHFPSAGAGAAPSRGIPSKTRAKPAAVIKLSKIHRRL